MRHKNPAVRSVTECDHISRLPGLIFNQYAAVLQDRSMQKLSSLSLI